ncbi:hypothetical protein [Streptomyces sp. NPDC047706]|uniref:hypothetical protein n=1 Tax=Streptomyces sp. NPDC047706 TaxID=3365486 RepID=UPI00371DFE34
MTTPLDHYFQIVDSAHIAGSALDALADIFTEDAVVTHSGEMARGWGEIIDLHRAHAANWAEVALHWTTAPPEAGGSLSGRWRQEGQDPLGRACRGSGGIKVALAPDGRISRLHLTLTDGSDRARVIIAKHLEVWMIVDPGERAEAMEGIYTEHVRFMEPDNVFVGRDALNDYVDAVQRKAPHLGGRVVVHSQNRNYIHWVGSFAFSGAMTVVGSEVLRLNGDLIDEVVVFGSDGTSL